MSTSGSASIIARYIVHVSWLCRVAYDWIGKVRERQTDRQTGRQTDRQAGRQAGRQTGNRQAGRPASTEADRQRQRNGDRRLQSALKPESQRAEANGYC